MKRRCLKWMSRPGVRLRLKLVGMTGFLTFLLSLAASGAVAESAHGRVQRVAIKVTEIRAMGDRQVRIGWRASGSRSRAAGVSIRRNGTVVGQFPASKKLAYIKVVPGCQYSLRLDLVTTRGKTSARSRTVHFEAPLVAPGRPAGLVAHSVADRSLQIAWQEAVKGSRPIVAYQISRDGRTVGRVRGANSATLTTLSSATEYEVSVAAVDSRGMLGRPASLRISTRHEAGSAPNGLALAARTSTSVTIRWVASSRGSAPIAGYRVYRDGRLVTTSHELSLTVNGLEPDRTYGFAVASVDTRSYISSLSETLTVSTSPPPQTTGLIRAFVLTSVESSISAFRRHYSQIGTIYPTFYECNRAGSGIDGQVNDRLVLWARARGVRVYPRVNCQRTETLHNVLNDSETRAVFLERLTELATSPNYEGINLDFEAGLATDRSAYSSFVRDLASRLKVIHKKLSVDVSPKTRDVLNHPRSTFFDYAAIGSEADEILVMGWGYHWATSKPGGAHDLPWWNAVLGYVAKQPQVEKFVMLLPAYSRDWPDGGGPSNPGEPIDWSEAARRAAEFGSTPTLDSAVGEFSYRYSRAGTRHEVWMIDASVMLDRIARARARGVSTGIWRMGQEDPAFWDRLGSGE